MDFELFNSTENFQSSKLLKSDEDHIDHVFLMIFQASFIHSFLNEAAAEHELNSCLEKQLIIKMEEGMIDEWKDVYGFYQGDKNLIIRDLVVQANGGLICVPNREKKSLISCLDKKFLKDFLADNGPNSTIMIPPRLSYRFPSMMFKGQTTGTTLIGLLTNDAVYMVHDGINEQLEAVPHHVKGGVICPPPNGIFCLNSGNVEDMLHMRQLATDYATTYRQQHGFNPSLKLMVDYYVKMLGQVQNISTVILGGGYPIGNKQCLFRVNRYEGGWVKDRKVKLFTCEGTGQGKVFARNTLQHNINENTPHQACIDRLRQAMTQAAQDPETGGLMRTTRITPDAIDFIEEVQL